MITASQSTPSVEDIKLSFPYPKFDKIQGEPNYESMCKLETQAIRNAATVEIALPPPHGNLAGIIEQPQVYLTRTGTPFPRPTYPGNAPVFPGGANVTTRQQMQQLCNTQLRNYYMLQTTERLIKTMLEQAIESTYLTGTHSDTQGFGTRTATEMHACLYQTYGRITTKAIINTTSSTSPASGHHAQTNRRLPTICYSSWSTIHFCSNI